MTPIFHKWKSWNAFHLIIFFLVMNCFKWQKCFWSLYHLFLNPILPREQAFSAPLGCLETNCEIILHFKLSFFTPPILLILIRETPYITPSYQSWLPPFCLKIRAKYKVNCKIVGISFLLAITFDQMYESI